MDIQRCINDAVERVRLGEIVPVLKEYESDVADTLNDLHISHTISVDSTNADRVIFERTQT